MHGAAPLFIRTHFSFLDGCRSPGDLCAKASELGYSSVCLIDRGGFAGLPELLREAVYLGLKPLTGVSVPGLDLVLLCLSPQGFARANEIITGVTLRDQESEDPARFGKYQEITGLDSVLPRAGGGRYDPVEDLCLRGWTGLMVLSGDRTILSNLARAGTSGLFAALRFGEPFAALAAWASARDIGIFALTDIFQVDPADANFYRILRAVNSSTSI
ncbi:MAG: PHP domain-containing protein, partial [Spirochaetales bacterium]|nr:PHP domain-containing protein [Spirochaetales bacterium]